MSVIKIYQIYHKPEQEPLLRFTPYYNENCSVYFENSVIAELVGYKAHKNSDYFGVFGPNFVDKIEMGNGPRVGKVVNYAGGIVVNTETDVLGMVRYFPHDPVSIFLGMHPRLPEFFAHVLYRLGHEYTPAIYEHVFYSNLFIARSEIYERYVTELLNPAMKVMDAMPELMCDSGYPRPLPSDLKQKWGIDFYPYHAFICERLFSYFVHLNKFNVKYY